MFAFPERFTQKLSVAIEETWFQNFWSPEVEGQYESGMILQSFPYLNDSNIY